ncbi:MAG: electron transport complex subunit RsxD [Burkholderiales bacterium]|nr:MAG: electron transport complex subunit RsxD [Burkholderiales bacterium]
MPAPFVSLAGSVQGVMLRVLLALLPAIAVHAWWYGPGILIQLALASAAALAAETLMLKLRGLPLAPFLSDLSALVTAWLLALCLPPIAPWWLAVVGTVFAIAVAKHLYGGLGSNLFNPAMVGYCVLILSFPAEIARWPAAAALASHPLGWTETAAYIFLGHLPAGLSLDALTAATPLDAVKTQLAASRTLNEIFRQPGLAEASPGPAWLALAYAAGGLILWRQRVIAWHVPAAYLTTLALVAGIFHAADPDRYAGPLFHLIHGAGVLGAFFILTDPVSGPTTPLGKLIFAASAALLTYLIRVFGGYPDGVAFAVLIMNMAVPLIDAYTQPPVYGKKPPGRGGGS